MTRKEKLINREYARLRRLAFPEHMQSYVLKWRAKHPGYATQIRRNWRRAHRERDRISHMKWVSKNMDQMREYWAGYRARKRSAKIGCQVAVRKIYVRAVKLRQWFDVVVDHIIPLSRGGEHSASNLQIIYRSENSAKGNRLDYHPSVIFV